MDELCGITTVTGSANAVITRKRGTTAKISRPRCWLNVQHSDTDAISRVYIAEAVDDNSDLFSTFQPQMCLSMSFIGGADIYAMRE